MLRTNGRSPCRAGILNVWVRINPLRRHIQPKIAVTSRSARRRHNFAIPYICSSPTTLHAAFSSRGNHCGPPRSCVPVPTSRNNQSAGAQLGKSVWRKFPRFAAWSKPINNFFQAVPLLIQTSQPLTACDLLDDCLGPPSCLTCSERWGAVPLFRWVSGAPALHTLVGHHSTCFGLYCAGTKQPTD